MKASASGRPEDVLENPQKSALTRIFIRQGKHGKKLK
jgi:hypothetical protein